jgi:predicted ATPase/DNA-binding SARP family transcriptional activator
LNDPWRITLFGGLRAQRGDQVISRFKTQRVASLFAYLAFHVRQAHSREFLVELLWPDSDAPRNSLSVALSSLRSQFEPPGVEQGTIIRADRFSVGLNPMTVTTDVAEFERELRAATNAGSDIERIQHLSEAVTLYAGPLLPELYEDWILIEQQRLSGLFFDATGELVAHLQKIGDTRTALSHARYAVAVDPLRDDSQQQLIRLLAAEGKPGAAVLQFKSYERLLEEEVGQKPSAALLDLVHETAKTSGLSPQDANPAPRKKVARKPATSLFDELSTVTFLETDIEGSIRLSQQAPEAFAAARERHHAILRREFSLHGGQEMQDSGGGFTVAFPTAGKALACAVAAQQALERETWPDCLEPLRVRMALHTGDVQRTGEDGQYHGAALQHATRMLAAANGGQILVSESTASLASGTREEGVRLVDLGVFRLRDVDEARRLFQAEYPHMPRTDFGPLAAEAGHKANVPAQFTRFFGREQEIAQLREILLSREVRLVTVMGPGGNGKSRLSVEVAERLAESFSGAVYFVALQDLTDPGLIPEAILASLGETRAPHKEPLDQAIAVLSEKPTLLVLDNFEHLVNGGVEVVIALLRGVPSLKLLTTSRQLLGLPAEREFGLSPLPVPGPGEDLEQLSLYDSVQLFIDRAQQVMPYFQITNSNAAAVAGLVGGLEGIPLAIELAAARSQVLTPTQMGAQLANRFGFLVSRKRGISDRQRTLRDTVDWSYRLLTPELQRFFYRLSVFRGGWTVEAAEAVCEEPLSLDYLEQLRECSLVLADEPVSGSIRFRTLETLREFGMERLTESKEADAVRDRHLHHFLSMAEDAHTRLTGPQQKGWLERLDSDHDNLRAALSWSSASDPDSCLRLCGGLYRFWENRGHFSEGRRWCAEALGRPLDSGKSASRATALRAAGVLAVRQGDFRAARTLLEECLALCREMNDTAGIAVCLDHLGTISLEEGRLDDARLLAEERLDIARAAGEQRGIAQAISNLGDLAYHCREIAEAGRLHEEALRTRREIGDLTGVAASLGNLGLVSLARGDHDLAQSLLEESLACSRDLGNKMYICVSLENLGLVAYARRDFVTARTLRGESLRLSRELGDQAGIAYSLESLGHLAAATQQSERAARLYGAAEALREAIGAPLSAEESQKVEAEAAALRKSMGEESFNASWQAGRTMDCESAISLALE